MTGAQTVAAFRRALIPALLAAVLTLAAVVGLLLSRPPTYQVRVGLIAQPVSTSGSVTPTNGTPTDFGQVVNLALPSLPEFVVADDVLAAIAEQVPNAPDAKVLRSSITVELVPASGVARIAVTTDDPTVSRRVLAVVIKQIDRANLLAPVAVLRTIGTPDPAPIEVGRDPLLSIGLGLVAAIAVSLLTVVLVQTVRPRLLTRPDVERIVDAIFEGEAPPPVVDVRSGGRGVDLLAAYLLAQDPDVLDVKVVATGPALPGDFGRLLRTSLRKVRAAREAGVALDPLAEADPFASAGGPSRAVPRHRTVPGGRVEPELLTTVLDAGLDDESPFPPVAGEPRRDPTGAGRTGRVPDLDGFVADAQGAHLVLTVRLRRTAPDALTTALITLRTHGTGVAGVAVS